MGIALPFGQACVGSASAVLFRTVHGGDELRICEGIFFKNGIRHTAAELPFGNMCEIGRKAGLKVAHSETPEEHLFADAVYGIADAIAAAQLSGKPAQGCAKHDDWR